MWGRGLADVLEWDTHGYPLIAFATPIMLDFGSIAALRVASGGLLKVGVTSESVIFHTGDCGVGVEGPGVVGMMALVRYVAEPGALRMGVDGPEPRLGLAANDPAGGCARVALVDLFRR